MGWNKIRFVFLSACLLFMVVFVSVGGDMIMAGATTYDLYTANNGLKVYDSSLKADELAMHFNPPQKVNSLEVFISGVSPDVNAGMTVSVYEWKENYPTSKKASPVLSKDYNGLAQDQWLTVDVAGILGTPLEPGEYIVVFNQGEGDIKINVVTPTLENTRTYMNGSARDGSIKMRVNFASEARTYSNAISDNVLEFVESTGSWVATDGLDRQITNTVRDTTDSEKYVGLFFHTWHSINAKSLNITEFLKEHPGLANDYYNPLWPTGTANFWNEPIWGYYHSQDEWVYRKQAELLADAMVDVVFFDCTNGVENFIDEVYVLCRVWSEARAAGIKTPQISFMLNMFDYYSVSIQLKELYEKIYEPGLYQELWFYWKGKPLMIGYPGWLNKLDPTEAAILDFFNYRVINHSQSWDNVQVRNPETGEPEVMGAIQDEVKRDYLLWNWISAYPQLINKNPDGSVEQVAVAIAHNWSEETHLTAMNNPYYDVFGRHYDPIAKKYAEGEDAKLYGAYFSAQWEYALDQDPEFIWVTGWNEWIAGRFKEWHGIENAFPDNFSDEYSRDIEPSKGDLKDHYYYLLVKYIRKFKGTPGMKAVTEEKTVDIYATEDQWKDVSLKFESYTGDTVDRDVLGCIDYKTGEKIHYTNETGRNDLSYAKMAHDDQNVYFMVETAEDITPYTDAAWMRLLIEVESIDGKAVTAENWETFQYIVNRNTPSSQTITTLERSTGGWNWASVGEVGYSVSGTRLQISIPKSLLGITGENFVINFKWSDNCQSDGDIMDFYTSGDVAPGGRFKYQYIAGKVYGAEGKMSLLQKIALGAAIGVAALAAIGGATLLGIKMKKKKKQ